VADPVSISVAVEPAEDEKLRVCAEKSGRPLEAYRLVLRALDRALTTAGGKRRHVEAEELCRSLVEEAVDSYGFLAPLTLTEIGVVTCRRVGQLVYELVAEDRLQTSTKDRREHFDDVLGPVGLLARVTIAAREHLSRLVLLEKRCDCEAGYSVGGLAKKLLGETS